MRTLYKIFGLLNHKEKHQLFIVGFAMTLMAALDSIGIVSIFPFISVLSNPEVIYRNKYLITVYNFFDFHSSRSFLIFLGSTVLFTTILSSVLSFLSNYKMIRFIEWITCSLSNRLMKLYLSRDYSFFLKRNSSELAQNLLSEIGKLISGVLLSSLQGLSKAIVVIILYVLLLFTDFFVAMVLSLILCSCYLLIFLIVKPKIAMAGKGRIIASRQRFEASSKAFGGIKEIKLFQNSDFFLREFASSTRAYGKYQVVSDILSVLPKHLIEIVAIGGIVSTILILYLRFTDMSLILPTLSLFAIGGYKSLPALQQLYNSITKINFYAPSVDLIYKDFVESEHQINEHAIHSPITFKDKIKFENVHFSYDEKARDIIKNLNFTIPANTTVGFVGPTGAGKTTVVDLMMGLLNPSRGQILIDGTPLSKNNIKSWQKLISYVPQRIYLADDSVMKNIAFGIDASLIDKDKVIQAAKMARIHDFITSELSQGYETHVGERGIRLSGGQAQRIGIARALYRNPDVLVLDEATSALDNGTESEIVEMIKNINGQCTIIIIAHRLSTVENCSQIFYFQGGELLATGDYEALLKNDSKFKNFATSKNKVLA